jgi:hypothetical protein
MVLIVNGSADTNPGKRATRKLEDSDRPFEAVSLEPSPLFLYQQLLRRFSTAAANKQLPTGNPRRF